MVVHFLGKEEVEGSIPSISTRMKAEDKTSLEPNGVLERDRFAVNSSFHLSCSRCAEKAKSLQGAARPLQVSSSNMSAVCAASPVERWMVRARLCRLYAGATPA